MNYNHFKQLSTDLNIFTSSLLAVGQDSVAHKATTATLILRKLIIRTNGKKANKVIQLKLFIFWYSEKNTKEKKRCEDRVNMAKKNRQNNNSNDQTWVVPASLAEDIWSISPIIWALRGVHCTHHVIHVITTHS